MIYKKLVLAVISFAVGKYFSEKIKPLQKEITRGTAQELLECSEEFCSLYRQQVS